MHVEQREKEQIIPRVFIFNISVTGTLNEDGENNKIRNSVFDMLTFRYLIQVEILSRKARHTSLVYGE